MISQYLLDHFYSYLDLMNLNVSFSIEWYIGRNFLKAFYKNLFFWYSYAEGMWNDCVSLKFNHESKIYRLGLSISFEAGELC